MNEKFIKTLAVTGLIIGGLFGMVGSFVPSASLRGLAWGLDGVGLILASSLLTFYFFRKRYEMLAAGFFIFAIGEGLILSSNTPDLNENVSSFGAGVILWATSLVLISLQNFFSKFIRLTGFIGAALFFIVAFQVFTGNSVNALTKPLPFYAYPFFAITIFGWAWKLLKRKSF